MNEPQSYLKILETNCGKAEGQAGKTVPREFLMAQPKETPERQFFAKIEKQRTIFFLRFFEEKILHKISLHSGGSMGRICGCGCC